MHPQTLESVLRTRLTHRRRTRHSFGALFIALIVTFSLTIGALAATGQWYDIPDFRGDADVIIDSGRGTSTGASASGRAQVAPTGSSCIYLEAKGVARGALDGRWSRLTQNHCGTARFNYNWSRIFYLAYNGMAFRICRVVNNGSDPCGSSKTIYW